MSWLYLFLAILFEILGTTFMKLSNGFSQLMPTIGTTISYITCFILLSFALKSIDMGIAYAIWSAAGLSIIAAIGIVFFHEDISLLKIFSLILIIAGVIGLNLSCKGH